MVRLVAPTALIEDEHVGSYPMKVELLDTIPGVNRRMAETLIAEISGCT